MIMILVAIYRKVFARVFFRRFNVLVHRLGLAGLGVLNYEDNNVSGESAFLKKYLSGKSSPVVFDVGANVGGYSKKILEVNASARVYAFEPHPKTFGALSREIGGQENVRLINAAVGSERGEMVLYDYSSNDGSEHASLYKEVIEAIHKSQAAEHLVDVVSVSEYFKSERLDKIDLLKIDTEGHELSVLLGAKELLAHGKVGAIHFEFNEMNVVSRTFFRDFAAALPKYKLYRLLPNGMLPLSEFSALHTEIFAYQNIVAILDIYC